MLEERLKLREELEDLYKVFKKSDIKTEESTKMAIILPVFKILGYDVFNPQEFSAEYTADIGFGVKNGEKVDYAILEGGKPYILIECKHHKERNLNKHVSQLFRYFSVTPARLGILTNGIEYRFYSDTQNINIMDKEPFYTFKINSITDLDLNLLKLFRKEDYTLNSIKQTIAIRGRQKHNEKTYFEGIDEFFKNQEDYLDLDYANLIFNIIFNGDIPKESLDKVVEMMRRAISKYKRVDTLREDTKSSTQRVIPTEIRKINEGYLELRLIDTVLDRQEMSFLKLVKIINIRTNKIWEVNSWAVFIETLFNDLYHCGMRTEDMVELDGIQGDDQGWIRYNYRGLNSGTQKFIQLENGLWLNTYGNANAMRQKLTKACTDYQDLMSSYILVMTRLKGK